MRYAPGKATSLVRKVVGITSVDESPEGPVMDEDYELVSTENLDLLG